MAQKPSSIFSVFTPWSRRFTDEHERELTETRTLYDRVRRLHFASPYADPKARTRIGGDIYATFYQNVPEDLAGPICRALDACLALEPQVFDFPEWREPLSLKEGADLRHFLRAKEHFLSRDDLELLEDTLAEMFGRFTESLPDTEAPSPFTIPLLCTLPHPAELIEELFGALIDDRLVEAGLFVELSKRYIMNVAELSGVTDIYNEKNAAKMKRPTVAKLPLDELPAFVKGTPFFDLLNVPVPLKFTYDERFSHMHVLGGSGAGKTQLLQNLILNDLEQEASLVIVDSQGDMIPKLTRLAAMRDKRVLLISPRDLAYPPALNVFDVKRLGDYDDARKEQVTAGVIQTFDYLFTGLIGADLTAKQSVFFRFIARLMLSLPAALGRNATILDMMALMDDPASYQAAIDALPPLQKQFFERDFKNKTFQQTREQIRYRLQAILENPTIANLFTASETKIDFFEELNAGSIVLVDTAKDFLKGASANFGRILISLILQAVLERAVIPETERHPALLIVDEAAEYFDTNVDDLLTEARKYKLGCVFAHQFLDQASSSLKASLAANTAIKFAGGTSVADARFMAPDMRTTPDFILERPRLHFAAYIRGVTPVAVSIPVEAGRLESLPKLSADEYDAFLALNHKLVCTAAPRRSAPATSSAPASSTAPPEPPDSTDPAEW